MYEARACMETPAEVQQLHQHLAMRNAVADMPERCQSASKQGHAHQHGFANMLLLAIALRHDISAPTGGAIQSCHVQCPA